MVLIRVFFWCVFELGFCCSIAYRVWEFIPSYDRAQMRKSALPLELFLSFWNPKSAGTCQPRNAMDGMGCTGEAGQTSKAGQFLRLHHSTYMEETLYSILSAIGSQCSLVKSGEA